MGRKQKGDDLSINAQLQDDIIERTIVLNRFSSGTGKRVVKLLQDAQADIIGRLPEVQGIVSRRRLLKQLVDIAEILDTAYTDIDALTTDELQQLADIEARWQFKSINMAAGIEVMRAMPTADMLREIVTNGLIVGNPSAEWWKQQSRKAQDEFKRVVRLGLSQSETNQQITKRVKDAIGIQQRGAFALVKTATQSVAVGARKSVLMSNPDVVKGLVSIATLDGRTTLLCANYDKAAYDLDLKPIPPNKLPFIDVPRHIGCRSSFSPLLKSWKEMDLPFDEFKPSTRASMDGQIPASTTFDDFLSRKPKEWQDKYLGRGRADLYREGKITLGDMISGVGRELTLEELREL